MSNMSDLDGDEISFEISEEGSEFVMDSDGRQVQVINLRDPGISQEVEVVTMEAPVSASRRGATASASSRTAKAHTHPSMSMQHLLSRGKSAPALLRNSRRLQAAEQAHYLGGPITLSGHYDDAKPAAAGSSSGTAGRQRRPSIELNADAICSINNDGVMRSGNLQHAILLDENGQPTDEIVVLAPNESGEYTIVERTTKESNSGLEFVNLSNLDGTKIDGDTTFEQEGQTIIICQDSEHNQFQQLVQDEEGNFIPIESNIPFQMDDGTIYLDESSTYDPSSSTSFFLSDSARPSKSKKKPKKPLQVIIGPDGQPLKKKGQTELKCMEKGCMMTCYNVSELRKHLTMSHLFQFDEEVVQFSSDKDFKTWRETYERERMVSFIYRGGTKKVARDQAVTYLVCHRSGHYKPTMSDGTIRKRKLKPQGSCKMGGYCTAGIKLMKNIDTGIVKMEICHTHYGHPLDSDAIPHLRVTPTLRKIILTKFKAGLSFTEVLAYIHHNPDRLEGLRLVDRRAVRNIYDTWMHPSRRSKQVQREIDELTDLIDVPIQSKDDAQAESSGECDRNMSDCELSAKVTNDEVEQPESTGSSSPSRPKLVLFRRPSFTTQDDEGPPTLIPVNNNLQEKEILKETRSMRWKKLKIPEFKPEPEHIGELVPETLAPKRSYGLRPNRKVEVYQQTKTKRRSDSLEQDEPKPKQQKNIKRVFSTKVNLKRKIKIEPHSESEDDEQIPPSPPMIVSELLEQAIEKLLDHGDSGPTVLLYKPLGRAANGESKRELRKNDFCVLLQTPVQRQLLQMFPNIIGFDVIEATKASQKHLKVAFLMVLDEYREPIPVAWLLTNSVESRILSSLFRSLKRECGDLKVKYVMAPRFSDAYKSWCSVFTEKPQKVLSDIEVRRDLKLLVWKEFSTDKGRREVWELVETLIMERQVGHLDIKYLEDKFEPLLDKLPHSGEFMSKLEKNWMSKLEEWTLHHRIGATVNIMGVSIAFNKLKKFIQFKGTKNLDENFEQILKIGYDKCFLRSKRMFKGDQKFSRYLDNIAEVHSKSRRNKNMSLTSAPVTEDTWIVSIAESTKIYTVSFANSPCDCKLVCRNCKICQHMYTCTCNEYITANIMCEHIHFVHCDRYQIVDEPELITGDICMEPELNSAFGKIETSGTEENPGAVINIEAVLKAAGLFHRSDGLQRDQIVSITDADTHTIIYENHPSCDDGHSDTELTLEISGTDEQSDLAQEEHQTMQTEADDEDKVDEMCEEPAV